MTRHLHFARMAQWCTRWCQIPRLCGALGRCLLLSQVGTFSHFCGSLNEFTSVSAAAWPGRFCHIILTPSFLRTGVAFKEGMCYGKAEAAALFFVTPTLLLVPELLPAHPPLR